MALAGIQRELNTGKRIEVGKLGDGFQASSQHSSGIGFWPCEGESASQALIALNDSLAALRPGSFPLQRMEEKFPLSRASLDGLGVIDERLSQGGTISFFSLDDSITVVARVARADGSEWLRVEGPSVERAVELLGR